MSSEVKVSVIVPVYNVVSCLKNTLDSICAQTLKDIEIILVDDGSSDGSEIICDEYAEKDSRIKVLHIDNGGPGRARNKGIDIAKGEYIGFVDSDDYIANDMYEKLFNLAKSKNADIAMCSYAVVCDEKVKSIKLVYEPFYEGSDSVKNSLLYRYYTGEVDGLYSLCNKIFRTELINENDIRIDEKLRRGEDAWFNFDVLKVANTVAYMPEALYFYIQNSTSIMHTVQKNQYEWWVNTRKRLLRENETLHFDIDYNQFYFGFYYKVAVYCRDLILSNQKDDVKAILSDSFYRENLKYIKNLPIHIRAIHTCAKVSRKLAYYLILLWSKKVNIRNN